LSERPKRRSRVLEALEAQAAEDAARAEEEPDIGTGMLDRFYEALSSGKKDEK
jgi:hypothetical protein